MKENHHAAGKMGRLRHKCHFIHSVTNSFCEHIIRWACSFIFFLALLAIWLVGQAHAQETVSGGDTTQSGKLRFDKDEYFAGETITILYPDTIDPKSVNKKHPEFLYSLIASIRRPTGTDPFPENPSSAEDKRIYYELSKGNNRYLDPDTGKEVVGGISQIRNVPACDATFQLYHRELGAVGKIYHIRIHPYVLTVPSALNVIAGETCGDPATIIVTPPAVNEFTLLKVKNKPKWTLTLYQLGSPLLGGRVVPDRKLEEWDVKEGVTQKIVWEKKMGLILPMRYELRLEWADYIIARRQFTQRPKAEPLSFTLKETTVPKPGEKFGFRYYGKVRDHVAVYLYRLGADGRLSQVLHRAPILEKTGETYSNFRVSEPGTYVARLKKGVDWQLTMDSLRIDIPPKRDPRYPQLLTTNYQSTFFEGDEIPVFVHTKNLFKNLKAMGRGDIKKIDDLSVSLYPAKNVTANTTKEVKPPDPTEMARMDAILKEVQEVQKKLSEAMVKGDQKAAAKYGKKMNELYEKMKGPSPAKSKKPESEPLKSWAVKLGKDEMLLIEGEYPPGEYIIKLQGIVRDHQDTFFQKRFAIIPRFEKDPIDLGGRDHFQVNEIIEVSLSPLPEQFDYELQVAGEGGFVPGCVYASPPVPRRMRLEGKRTASFRAPIIPGIYYLRLCTTRNGTWVLSELRFEVLASADPENIITLDKNIYKPRENMQVTVYPDAAIYFPDRDPDKDPRPGFYWRIMSMGQVAAGGAVKPPLTHEWWDYITDIHKEKSKTIKAPYMPGVYAIALYAPYIDDFGEPMVLKYFDVAIPGNPPVDQGPYGAKPPSSLPGPDYPFLPWGEYFERGYCKEFDLEEKPEQMELRFVQWSEGKYVPIEGDLEFGQFFYIEGLLKEPAKKDAYFVQTDIPNGGEKEVMLSVTNDDDKLVRSEMLYFIWDGLGSGGDYESN